MLHYYSIDESNRYTDTTYDNYNIYGICLNEIVRGSLCTLQSVHLICYLYASLFCVYCVSFESYSIQTSNIAFVIYTCFLVCVPRISGNRCMNIRSCTFLTFVLFYSMYMVHVFYKS